jgi:hypothetical protein
LINDQTPEHFLSTFPTFFRSRVRTGTIDDFPRMLEQMTLSLGWYAEQHNLPYNFVQQADSVRELMNLLITKNDGLNGKH